MLWQRLETHTLLQESMQRIEFTGMMADAKEYHQKEILVYIKWCILKW